MLLVLQDSLDSGNLFGIVSVSTFYAFHLSCISWMFSFRPSFSDESDMSVNNNIYCSVNDGCQDRVADYSSQSSDSSVPDV